MIPSMMEYIAAGFRSAILAGWGAVLLVEWFGNDKGVGFRAHYWYDARSFEGMMAWGLVMMITILRVRPDRDGPGGQTLPRLADRGAAVVMSDRSPADGRRPEVSRAWPDWSRDDVKKVFPPSRAGQDPVFALRNMSFEAEGHAFVTLVGPSGCGKSTFLNMVSGHRTAERRDARGEGRTEGDARIGYVFQDPRLLPWKTVLENMMYVLDEGSHDERVGTRTAVPRPGEPRHVGRRCIRASSPAGCSSGSASPGRSRSNRTCS